MGHRHAREEIVLWMCATKSLQDDSVCSEGHVANRVAICLKVVSEVATREGKSRTGRQSLVRIDEEETSQPGSLRKDSRNCAESCSSLGVRMCEQGKERSLHFEEMSSCISQIHLSMSVPGVLHVSACVSVLGWGRLGVATAQYRHGGSWSLNWPLFAI